MTYQKPNSNDDNTDADESSSFLTVAAASSSSSSSSSSAFGQDGVVATTKKNHGGVRMIVVVAICFLFVTMAVIHGGSGGSSSSSSSSTVNSGGILADLLGGIRCCPKDMGCIQTEAMCCPKSISDHYTQWWLSGCSQNSCFECANGQTCCSKMHSCGCGRAGLVPAGDTGRCLPATGTFGGVSTTDAWAPSTEYSAAVLRVYGHSPTTFGMIHPFETCWFFWNGFRPGVIPQRDDDPVYCWTRSYDHGRGPHDTGGHYPCEPLENTDHYQDWVPIEKAPVTHPNCGRPCHDVMEYQPQYW